MPNGYSVFVLFIIMALVTVLVGGGVLLYFTGQEMVENMKVQEAVIKQLEERIAILEEQLKSEQTQNAVLEKELEAAKATIAELTRQLAEATKQHESTSNTLGKIASVAMSILGTGGGALALVRRGWGAPRQRTNMVAPPDRKPNSQRTYNVTMNETEMKEFVQQRRRK